jgi:hypothetical protein
MGKYINYEFLNYRNLGFLTFLKFNILDIKLKIMNKKITIKNC